MAEGVRISRTGAEKILNSKTIYNRSSLPRVVCLEEEEVQFLGDMDQMPDEECDSEDDEVEVILMGVALERREEGRRGSQPQTC